MMSLSRVNTVLQTYWQAAEAGMVPTQFPGVPLDAARLQEWFEFWVTQSIHPVSRRAREDRLNLLIDIHCFSRRAEKRRINEMTDAVRDRLSHLHLPVIAADPVDSPDALLRIHESTVRDLTRENRAEPRGVLQHLVVSFTAQVESTGPPFHAV